MVLGPKTGFSAETPVWAKNQFLGQKPGFGVEKRCQHKPRCPKKRVKNPDFPLGISPGFVGNRKIPLGFCRGF
jgi:hypothetical protein